jgi:ADP-heptose:LPS heptosyltransferase
LVPPVKKPLAIVHPGASVAEKRWPAQAFGRVAETLTWEGYAVAVTGSAGEKKLTRRVSELAPGTMDLGGQTNLSTLIALVARASVLISNDTGPAHLAYALQRPSVTIFGPSTDVERWGPLNRRRHAVVFGDPISNVSADNVLRSIEALVMGQERLGA